MPLDMVENRSFGEIEIGDVATVTRRLVEEDVQLFAALSGDVNVVHLSGDGSGSRSVHSMWLAAMLSGVLGTQLPGPGTRFRTSRFEFLEPLQLGDTATLTVTVREKHVAVHEITLDCTTTNGAGRIVARGEARVMAPVEKLRVVRQVVPTATVARLERFNDLVDSCKGLSPIPTAVVHPVDADSLQGAIDAAMRGLIDPILVAPQQKLRAVADAAGIDLTPYRIINVEHSHAAAAEAAQLAKAGTVSAIMKGSLHSDEVLGAILPSAIGLRTARRISHVFIMDVPTYPKLLCITDAAVNIQPSLEDKADIVQNAIDLCRALGIDRPKVAILSAVETVTSKIPSTLDAAALCKMADRGQITGAILDGPLAFDNAISAKAAASKHIVSDVPGDADVLLMPDLEAANLVAKQLTWLAGAEAAGIVLGARIPIMLTSRSDSAKCRLASAAVARRLAAFRETGS